MICSQRFYSITWSFFSQLIILLRASNFQKMSSDDHTREETDLVGDMGQQLPDRVLKPPGSCKCCLFSYNEWAFTCRRKRSLFWHPTSKLSPRLKRAQFTASSEGGSVHNRPLKSNKRWKGKGFILAYLSCFKLSNQPERVYVRVDDTSPMCHWLHMFGVWMRVWETIFQ